MGNKIVQEKENVPVLSVEELSVSFNMYQKGLRRENLEVLHKLSLSIHAGEILV